MTATAGDTTVKLTISHQERDTHGAFYIEQRGDWLAEMGYTRRGPTHVNIDHTEVDESLSGQRVGRQLLDALVAWARATQTTVSTECPFAAAQFARDPSIRDVLL